MATPDDVTVAPVSSGGLKSAAALLTTAGIPSLPVVKSATLLPSESPRASVPAADWS